jgi:hypothetical protein
VTGAESRLPDRFRQVVVVIAAATCCLLGPLIGAGVIGTPVPETAGGALASDATLLAPTGPAFAIWSVIYGGIAGYALWQALPRHVTDTRQRDTGLLAAATMLLNTAWMLVTQAGWLWGSVAVIGALLAALAVLVRRLSVRRATSVVERVLVDGTFGLYLGWVAVATCANLAAAVTDSALLPAASPGAEAAAIALLIIVGAVGVTLALRWGGRWAIGIALAWGLAWIAVGRLSEAPASDPTGAAAIVAAVGCIAAPLAARVVGNRGWA